jgi:hypothetical protein
MLIHLRDILHERLIAQAKAALLAARTFEERRQRAAEMCGLINSRSADRVAQMEQQKGLV